MACVGRRATQLGLWRRQGLARSMIRAYTSTIPTNDPIPEKKVQNVSDTNSLPTTAGGQMDAALQELPKDAEERRVMQAPNRATTWSRSQRPRSEAMVGPRFEQTLMEYQPQPWAAIELIHKQPVRWTKERHVSCDGGGGPLGHPRIFINLDQPNIISCNYCGLPFANEHHRKQIEALPSTSYPLEPQGGEVEINESQRITNEPLGQR